MRYVRKLTLLVLAVIATLAFVAAPASAADPIEVVNEKTATVCSDLLSPHTVGGCTVHASGTIKLEVWIFTWVYERSCDVEVEWRVGGDGTAVTNDLDTYSTEARADSDCGTNPPVVMCDPDGGAPPLWEGAGEEVSWEAIRMMKHICFDPVEGDVCDNNIGYDIVEGADEALSFVLDEVVGLCRISGAMTLESAVTGNAAIHIHHL